MGRAFSVKVDIGGRINASLGQAIAGTQRLIGSLSRSVVAANARTVNASTQRAVQRMGRVVSDVGERMQEKGRGVSSTLSAPLGLAAVSAGRAAFEFEKAGNFLEALGDASVAQRTKFEELANELNKKYPQALAEIIKTGNEMLKGGFNFDQMLGSIDQTLATAVLGDMTPSEVGNMMARTINSFQMPMTTYGDAMRSSVQVSDRMTYAAVKTTASLKDMGEMFRYVGGAMSASGGNIDQATAFAMAFAKNGTVGSEAGVALRSAIVRMVKMPDKGHAALARIGMNLNNYVGGKQALSADRILAGLQSGGIDASGAKGEIEKLLANKNLADSPAKLQAAITKAVQAKMGSTGAFDAKTIAENVNDSITMAGAQIDVMRFFKDLQEKLKAGLATHGDIAAILEGRHFSRYQAILQSNLDELIKGITTESNGYTQSRYGTVLKGIVGPVYEVSAALEKLSVSLGRIVFPGIAKALSSIADGLQSLSENNPTLLKLGTYAGLATIALGPFLLVAGAAGRVLGPLARGLMLVGAAATTGLAARLVAVAAGVRAIALAALLGAAGRLRAMAAGLIALGAVGGGKAVLGAMAAGILSFGRAVLMFPVMALRAIGAAMFALVANPVGIAITAIVTALAALGLWVHNNWRGLKVFFDAFGQSFMKALGPEAGETVKKIANFLGDVWQSINDLLGPIDSVGTKWAEWGAKAGEAVGSVVRAIGELPGQIMAQGAAIVAAAVDLGQKAYNAFLNIDWAGLGLAIVKAIGTGIVNAASYLVDAAKSAATSAVNAAKGALGFGGGAAAASGASAAAGAKGGAASSVGASSGPKFGGAFADGGVLKAGRWGIVGEKGPEVIGPAPFDRHVTANDNLRALASPEAVSASSGRASLGGNRSLTLAPTIHIHESHNPRAVRREIEDYMRGLESQQHAMLSD